MKRTTLLAAAGTALMIASAAVAHPVGVDNDAMDKRFQEMGRMMDGMGQMHGPARRAGLRDHMRLMQEQMGAMHGMQGGHGQGGPGGPAMGQAPSRGPSGAAPAAPDMQQRMGAMEHRMDAMQRMMEHMLRQQEMREDDDRS